MLHPSIRWASSAIVVLLFSMLASCSDNPSNSIPRVARDFADEHWDGDRYLLGLKAVYYWSKQDIDSLDPYMDTASYVVFDDDGGVAFAYWSHHAFFNNDGSPVAEDTFYENIGKYFQFNFGWDDFPQRGDPEFPTGSGDTTRLYVLSPNTIEYQRMWDD